MDACVAKVPGPQVSDDEFAALWEKSEKQEKLAKKLIKLYIPLVKKILAESNTDEELQEATELKDELLRLMESYVPLKRYLLSLSHVQQKLKSYQVFLSHAGEQKSSYACWVEDALVRQRSILNDANSSYSENKLAEKIISTLEK